MTTYDSTTGHRLSPHAHDFEDGDERPLPARKRQSQAPTTDEVWQWFCALRYVNPNHLTDARWRSLRYNSDQAAAKLTALYANALTARIEAVYSEETR